MTTRPNAAGGDSRRAFLFERFMIFVDHRCSQDLRQRHGAILGIDR